MNTPGPAPDVFSYPESRTGKAAVVLIAAALGSSELVAAMFLLAGGMTADETFIHGNRIPLAVLASIAAVSARVIEHERSALVGLAFLPGMVLTHVSINGL